ncbi:LemA family protein [Neochlamydia sp. S13]|uniref:LemA family protein n=1 Tax=Neochlamydia sp. S13 TaxID=1353976 RepID=UPI0005A96F91|nr:LemA family protein [Neochlamydia sp. S13]BBI17074.1 protein LemA [Neochlamydia sp. S13]
MLITIGVIIAILAVIALSLIGIYNRLIETRNQVKNAWSQIDVQLQRRYDLIPNLVETVKGYMGYEKSTLEAVIEARSQASAIREQIKKSGLPSHQAMKELMSTEASLKAGLGNIYALAENYPQLKASDTMHNLQEELSTTENKVAFARQAYNDQVLAYNNIQQKFPAALIATSLGHHPAELYEAESEESKKAVKVSFSS